jgi:hypothetical protein
LVAEFVELVIVMALAACAEAKINAEKPVLARR